MSSSLVVLFLAADRRKRLQRKHQVEDVNFDSKSHSTGWLQTFSPSPDYRFPGRNSLHRRDLNHATCLSEQKNQFSVFFDG